MKKILLVFGLLIASLVSLAQSPESIIKSGCTLMEHDNNQIKILINDPDIDWSTKQLLIETYKTNAKLLKLNCNLNMPPLKMVRNSINEDQAEPIKYRSYIGYLRDNDVKMYNRLNIRIYENDSINALDKKTALEMACKEYCNEKEIYIKRW